jgi:hypothetical protein
MLRALLTLGLALVTVVSGVPAAASAVAPATLSTAPTGVAATAGVGTVQLTWGAPSTPSGTVSDYVVQFRLTTTSTYSTANDGVSTDLSAVLAGLKRGSSYYVKVAAVTESGRGAFSSAVLVKTLTGLPSAPAQVYFYPVGTSTIEVSWNAVTTTNGGGDVVDYVVLHRLHGTTTWRTLADGVSTERSTVITGLLRSRDYEIAVYALTSYGRGPSRIFDAYTLHGIPGRPNVWASARSVSSHAVSWSDATPIGSPVIDYVVQYRQAGYTTWRTVADGISPTASRVEITGLKRGVTYETRVWAKSVFGSGSPQTARFTVHSGLPTAPRNVTWWDPTLSSVSLDFGVPTTGDNITPISGYRVLVRPVGTTTWREATFVSTGTGRGMVTGLARGAKLELALYATTVYGRGPSTLVTVQTQSGVPSAITALTLEPSAHTVLVKSATPWNNGSPIIDYVVRYRPVGSATWTVFPDGVSANPWITVTGLNRLAPYEFSSYAVSAIGAGGASPITRTTTLSGVPGAVTVLSSSSRMSTSSTNPVRVTADPAYPITSYEIDYRVLGAASWTTLTLTELGPGDTVTIDGLTPSGTYEVRARAFSAQGAGPYGPTRLIFPAP